MSDEILDPLDLSDFEVCVERTKDVLELIHTNICGPFPMASWNGQ